jgi:peptidoglycan/xylan/chitin deacetylase (PgdA/CDA1 family)
MPDESGVEYYNVHPKEFDQQMSFLSQGGFSVVSLQEVLQWREQGVIPVRRSVVIVFHDGFGDNYMNAFPTLKKHGLTATFFMVTDYIDGEEPFSWLKWDENARAHCEENSTFWLPLTSEQILEMSTDGMLFGSHTCTHARLAALDGGKAFSEMKVSKERLEGLLKKPVELFAFPFGLWGDIRSEHVGFVQQLGYQAALTAKIGANDLSSDFYDLRVIPVYEWDSLSEFKKKVEGGYDWLGLCHKLWISTFPKRRGEKGR